jgi:hypothetical protein
VDNKREREREERERIEQKGIVAMAGISKCQAKGGMMYFTKHTK